MVDRRTVLAAVSSLAIPSVSGCIGGGSGAEEHLEVAYDALDSAGTEMSNEADKFENADYQSGDGIDIRTAEIREYLDTASNELDAAAEDATSSQRDRIEAVRGYIEFARAVTEFTDILAEGVTQMMTGFTYFQAERYGDAESQMQTTEDTFATSMTRLSEVQVRYDDLDTSLLDDIDQVEVETLQSDIDRLREYLPAFQAVVTGMQPLSAGMVEFEAATTALDEDRIEAARQGYLRAEEQFITAHSTFAPMETEAPAEIQSTFIKLTCTAGAIRDASNYLASGIRAYQNGNQSRAEQQIEQGREAANRCSF